jgi:UDP-N-acetylmuramyl pentapeptide phosphotransferase/UDP-N-acetylglucosamine-1-phosphate transferase
VTPSSAVALTALVFGLAYWMTHRLCVPTARVYWLDRPNERSLHTRPVPRTGGLAIVMSAAIGLLAARGLRVGISAEMSPAGHPNAWMSPIGWILTMAVAVGAVSLWTDRRELSPATRFTVHILAAVGVVWGGDLALEAVVLPAAGSMSLGHLGGLVSIAVLVWMANLYNFMDGMDGFAGGMTLIGFGVLSAIAAGHGHPSMALVALLPAAAAAGFLPHNLPPARIFMGDAGSVSLGFLAGALMLLGVRQRIFDIWTPLLIFSPFILDASLTLVRRFVQMKRIWHPHHEHYYQRLVLAGVGHRRTVLAEYGLMLACGVTALYYVLAPERERLILLLAWAVIYAVLIFAVRVSETHHMRRRGSPV